MIRILLRTAALFCLLQNVQAQVQRTGKDYAVFFYVTDFKPGLTDLRDTKPEAEALHQTLTDDYGFECKYVPECTKKQIEDELKYWNKKLTAGDQVLFYFSMHGYYDKESDRGYLIPSNGEANDNNNYFTSWLSYDDLRTYLAPCKATHVLVGLDACYSGSFGIRSNRKPDEPDYNNTGDCATRVAETMKYKSRQFITAGKVTDATPGKSIFAETILKNLRTGYSTENVLLLDDLAHQLHKLKSPEPEDGTFVGHTGGGDFVFMRKNACGTTQPPKNDPDQKAIELARRNPTEENWQEYLDNWKTGRYRPEAETALYNMQEDRVWKSTYTKNTELAYNNYIKIYCPGGRYCTQATKKLKTLPPLMPDDDLVLVPGGTFTMGCTNEQKDCGDNEKRTHQVTLSDFYIGRYEVTQHLWTEIMGDNPASFKNGDNYPVEQVSWDDIQTFLSKLNTKYPNHNYRLPTEAEWEYAARGGGKEVLFGNGKNVLDPKEANFDVSTAYKKPYSVAGEYRQKTTPVGSFAPNALGLYDMSDNVCEWCSDWYGADYYKNSPTTNPQGPTSGSSRLLRGGSWSNSPQSCRVAYRSYCTPDFRNSSIGFRLARTK